MGDPLDELDNALAAVEEAIREAREKIRQRAAAREEPCD